MSSICVKIILIYRAFVNDSFSIPWIEKNHLKSRKRFHQWALKYLIVADRNTHVY